MATFVGCAENLTDISCPHVPDALKNSANLDQSHVQQELRVAAQRPTSILGILCNWIEPADTCEQGGSQPGCLPTGRTVGAAINAQM